MASLAQNASSFGQGDPNAILNECRSIDQGIDQIENNLNQLRMLQDRSLNDADTSGGSSTSRQLDALSSETMSMYRELTERVRQVKSSPDSRQPKNSPQVGRIDRRLKQAIQQFQQVESAFRKKTQDQMARQYRIVRPDAPESEVRAAVEDVSGQGNQVFQQAMMQSSRQGQARAVLNAVQDRHAALQRIEQQMIELAQLFQDMDTLVVQQEVAITQIEQKGEEVVENLDKGNEEIAVAVTTARKTRKKKWICLGIVGELPLSQSAASLATAMVKTSLICSNSRHHCYRRRGSRGICHDQQGWFKRQQEASYPVRGRGSRFQHLRAVEDPQGAYRWRNNRTSNSIRRCREESRREICRSKRRLRPFGNGYAASDPSQRLDWT